MVESPSSINKPRLPNASYFGVFPAGRTKRHLKCLSPKYSFYNMKNVLWLLNIEMWSAMKPRKSICNSRQVHIAYNREQYCLCLIAQSYETIKLTWTWRPNTSQQHTTTATYILAMPTMFASHDTSNSRAARHRSGHTWLTFMFELVQMNLIVNSNAAADDLPTKIAGTISLDKNDLLPNAEEI